MSIFHIVVIIISRTEHCLQVARVAVALPEDAPPQVDVEQFLEGLLGVDLEEFGVVEGLAEGVVDEADMVGVGCGRVDLHELGNDAAVE